MSGTPSVDCDVLIVGMGPVGLLLANLLGGLGVRTHAIDAAAGLYPLPRAAVIDDEVLRIMQSVGLDGAVLADAQPQRTISYRTWGGRRLEIMRPDHGTLGQPPMVSINQPAVERTLLAGLARYPHVTTAWNAALRSTDDQGTGVLATADQAGGATAINAAWVVGCDGARSVVRDHVGATFGGSSFAQRWLVVDARVDRPVAAAPHPVFVGDPRRPIVSLPMSPGRHRWEWMLHPGEREEAFVDAAEVARLMAPWLGDEAVTIERAVVYTFHARTASRWRAGRLLIAGDAAHLMPPFVGQGFSSGARDAANLAWKLAAVIGGGEPGLLDSYEVERRPHATGMQRLAVGWGGVLQTTNRAVARLRDATLVTLDRTGVLAVVRERIKPRPTVGAGAFARRPARRVGRRTIGTLFPQPLVLAADGVPVRLDDLLGAGWSVIATDPAAGATAEPFGAPVYVLDTDLHDSTGLLRRWLGRAGSTWVLLRPDGYVFACGGASHVTPTVEALRRCIGRPITRPTGA